MRLLKKLLLGLLALLLLAVGTATFLVWRQLPTTAVPALVGLSAPVSVDLDGRGLPTIHAQSLDDANRIQGYLTARERLFQMDLMRRKADGRLAELVGAGALPLAIPRGRARNPSSPRGWRAACAAGSRNRRSRQSASPRHRQSSG